MDTALDTVPSDPGRDDIAEAATQLVAGMRPGWVMLQDCRLGDTEVAPVRFVLLHPEVGVALLDLAPALRPDAVARLRERLEAARFASIFPGHLPVVHRALPLRQLRQAAALIDYAFALEPRLSLPGGGAWTGTVHRALDPAPVVVADVATPRPPPLDPERRRAVASRRQRQPVGLLAFWAMLAVTVGAGGLLLATLGPPGGAPGETPEGPARSPSIAFDGGRRPDGGISEGPFAAADPGRSTVPDAWTGTSSLTAAPAASVPDPAVRDGPGATSPPVPAGDPAVASAGAPAAAIEPPAPPGDPGPVAAYPRLAAMPPSPPDGGVERLPAQDLPPQAVQLAAADRAAAASLLGAVPPPAAPSGTMPLDPPAIVSPFAELPAVAPPTDPATPPAGPTASMPAMPSPPMGWQPMIAPPARAPAVSEAEPAQPATPPPAPSHLAAPSAPVLPIGPEPPQGLTPTPPAEPSPARPSLAASRPAVAPGRTTEPTGHQAPARDARAPAPPAAVAAAVSPRCRTITIRIQLGEELTHADRSFLRSGCGAR